MQDDKAQIRVWERRLAKPGSRHQVHRVRAASPGEALAESSAAVPPEHTAENQRGHLQAVRCGQSSRTVLASRPPQPTPWHKLQSMPADPAEERPRSLPPQFVRNIQPKTSEFTCKQCGVAKLRDQFWPRDLHNQRRGISCKACLPIAPEERPRGRPPSSASSGRTA